MPERYLIILLLLLAGWRSQAQWQLQQPGTSASFRAVSAPSATIMWAGGSQGTVARTVDGGASWQVLTIPGADSLDFRGIVAFDASRAIVTSAGPAERNQARIYETLDGGKSWQLRFQTQTAGVFFDGIAFWDRRHGIVFSDPVDGKWFLLCTQNGGRTWQRIPPDALPPMHKGEAAFAASNSAMVVEGRRNVWIGSGGATAGRVFRSQNRGKSWTVAETPILAGASSGIFGLRFWTSRHGMAVGGDYRQEKEPVQNIIATSDGGQTWQPVTPVLPPGLKEAIGRLADGRLVAVGPSGTSVSADNGKTWVQAVTEGFHALSCAGNTCWAVGARGKIARQTFR
ncbi:oxidoreductase [Nibrella saemangeumensis]|uniref:Oxidoreductase n=1 Tax=Nibrella saemangeumensis TaxID=1084526 RepID=A0ABP8MBR5_9BACT